MQRRGGLIAASFVVFCLLAGGAAILVGVKGETPSPAEPAASGNKVTSLPVPPRPVPSAPFRSFSAAELGELVEVTDEGQRLPRVAPSGWMPWIAHARRFDPAAGSPARVGVLVINLGADEALGRRAIDALPGEVSLAFLPGTPDLPRWLREARARGHEVYLMLPAEEPGGLAERGLKPVQASAEAAENVRRLRAAMARGEGYVGFVIASAGPVWQSEATARPVLKEIADRGLALIEIETAAAPSPVHRLTEGLGIGYARTADVLDYKLSDGGIAGNLDRLDAWTGETAAEQPPRHRFGVVQPDDASIDAILAWLKRRPERPAASLVPIIGHFECRAACMMRMRLQAAQLRP
jgi:polysaccharide deacetylase 2 family uncharacterized protein YibQ